MNYRILLLLAGAFYFLNADAQKMPLYKRLYPGDKIELDAFRYTSLKNYKKDGLKLSDFRNKKLLILDFWNKECPPCIGGMPKMQELQAKFENDIQVLLITRDSIEHERMRFLFQKSKILKEIKLPIIMHDTILWDKVFPHTGEPYHVWIDTKGEVLAATNAAAETNERNIRDFLERQVVNVKEVTYNTDRLYPAELEDPTFSLLKLTGKKEENKIIYYSPLQSNRDNNAGVLEKKELISSSRTLIPSLHYSFFMANPPLFYTGKNGFLRDRDGKPKGLRVFQESLEYYIREAYPDLHEKADPILADRYFISSSAKPFYEEMTDTTNQLRRQLQNRYSYESCMENFTREKAQNLLRLDFERCFGLKAVLEKRELKCIVFRVFDKKKFAKMISKDSTSNSEIFSEGDKQTFRNYSFHGLLALFASGNRSTDDPALINEIGFGVDADAKIDLTLNTSTLNLNDRNRKIISRDLEEYGIELVTTYKQFNVLVLYGI